MKVRKSYSFALWTSVYFTAISLISAILLIYVFNISIDILYIFYYAVITFLFSFIIIQFRVEKFIHQRVKSIYDKIPFFKSEAFSKKTLTSDIKTLSEGMQKYAEYNSLKIRSLNRRENYRREFLGNVSHELKTPIFTIQGYLLTLTDGAINDKKIRLKYLKRANKGVERLISIVKDLDLISKLESDNMELNKQPFDIVRLTKDVFELLEMKAKKKNILLSFNKNYDYPIIVTADLDRIEQVLTNLIVNSIKYGTQGGDTIVSIESKGKHKIILNIADDGEGLTEEDKKRIFERFFRVDKSRSRKQGGSGLGLSIVKHIIEAHGEEIFVQSEYKKGSIFSFTLEKHEKI